MLELLVRHSGRLVTGRQLLAEVWGPVVRDRNALPARLPGPVASQARTRPVAAAPPADRARTRLPLPRPGLRSAGWVVGDAPDRVPRGAGRYDHGRRWSDHGTLDRGLRWPGTWAGAGLVMPGWLEQLAVAAASARWAGSAARLRREATSPGARQRGFQTAGRSAGAGAGGAPGGGGVLAGGAVQHPGELPPPSGRPFLRDLNPTPRHSAVVRATPISGSPSLSSCARCPVSVLVSTSMTSARPRWGRDDPPKPRSGDGSAPGGRPPGPPLQRGVHRGQQRVDAGSVSSMAFSTDRGRRCRQPRP